MNTANTSAPTISAMTFSPKADDHRDNLLVPPERLKWLAGICNSDLLWALRLQTRA